MEINGQKAPLQAILEGTLQRQGEPQKNPLKPSLEAPWENIQAWAIENERTGGTYLKNRGISLEVQKMFKIGLCHKWTHPKTEKERKEAGEQVFYSERVIIPSSKETYTARATDPKTPKKYKAINFGNSLPFNLKALEASSKSGRPVFICEGEIDSLSFEEIQAFGVGLGGVGNVSFLLQEMGRTLKNPFPFVILCLDFDLAGRKASKELLSGLKKLGVLAIEAPLFSSNFAPLKAFEATLPPEQRKPYLLNYLEEESSYKAFKAFLDDPKNSLQAEAFCKDPNEFLQKEPEAFTAWASMVEEEIQFKREAERENYSKEFLQVFSDFVHFKDKNLTTEPIQTGFPTFDSLLNGGFENRLYVLGAVPSLGKSTFLLQIASHIAESGKDVLFFALEMASSELISKSLSCLTCKKSIERRISLGYSRTATEISRREKWEDFPKTSKDILSQSISHYGTYINPHLFIFEGLGEVGLSDIRGAIERHKRATGKSPVVFVDYLQIMKVEEACKGMSDKQIVDRNILSLKKLSKEEGLPVICVSSFGRSNYSEEAGQGSFKESGAIEYGADVLLALQLQVISSEEFTKKGIAESEKRRMIKEALRENVGGINQRRISLQVLKNRSGELGEVSFKFFPAYNYFKELPTATQQAEGSPKKPEEVPSMEDVEEETAF